MSGASRGSARDTRRRLLDTFNSLVLSGAEGKITVADIVREAGVGRSTFYDHYASADDIHEQALAGPMTLLAESVLGQSSEWTLDQLLAHFWENRARADRTLSGEDAKTVERLLVEIIELRLPRDTQGDAKARRIAAIELAVVPLALIRAWLKGTVKASATEMARHITEAAARLRESHR